ncbi:probable E3 ubiquitin-protein ligase MARCHF10 isoform X2 [Sceloporus undulatus]|uniref:probable E3 ubiquitin-protein ligase MARCHF10 isoform X2 n=1 Tax=Sceloporus undulatus TaxID=8520 RepID=UPI001C4AE4E0|nr:probable E3 ubiquitin-protein ligase MARCHF10 isoform X2 [Sceloporus undulatus]
MYEAKERQKFISDAQYLREMQHKMDSEYQACLRKQELAKEQPEKKRDQHHRQEMRQTTISSISAVRSYERPWVSRLPANRQISSDEASGRESKSSMAMKSLGNKSEAKFPAIDKTSVKQKQKASTGSRKPDKNGSCPKKDILAFQKPILSRRRMNQRSLIDNYDSENMKKLEGRGRKTPVLQGITKNARGSDPQDGTGQKTGHTLKSKKKSQEKRSLIQSSKLSIDSKSLERDLKKGNVLTAIQQPATNPVDSTVQVTNGPSVSSESSNTNLPPIKNTPTRPKEDDFYTMLCSNVENSTGENDELEDVIPLEEELLSSDFGKRPLHRSNRIVGMSLTQTEQRSSEMGVGSDGRLSEFSHRLLWQHNVMEEPAAEQSAPGQRKIRDQTKSHTLEEKNLEDAHKNEGETLAHRPHAESRPGNATTDESVANSNSGEDWAGNNVYVRERQNFESNQRCYAGFVSAARPTVQRACVRSTFNIPGSLVQPAALNRTEATGGVDVATASVQVTELSGSPRFTVRRQLSPIRFRDSFSASESCQSSSPAVSTLEESSLLEDSTSSVSPSTTSHDEDSFLNSHSSSSSTDSPHPPLFRANFTAHLHMSGSLSDQVPIFLTVSDLRNQSSFVSSTSTCSSPEAKEINKPEIDPEKIKKLQESLLAEDSEEEGDQCRICQIAEGSITNPLLEPCGCGGSLRFVHQECLKTWLKAKIKSGAELGAVKTCELCKQSLTVDLDDFNVNDYYRNHQQSRAQDELMNSGLYLVLLLHLYEQRFAELMRLNYNQASRDRLSRQPRTEESQNSANSSSSG